MSSKEILELPLKLSKENYDKVIIALYTSNAHEKQVNRRIIADTTGINVDSISRSHTFLASISALEKKGKDVMLTKEGENYARNLLLKNDEAAKSSFNVLIRNNDITSEVISYLKIPSTSTEEELKNKILDFSTKKITSDHKAGANTFYDMLIYSEIITAENDSLVLSSMEGIPKSKLQTVIEPKQIIRKEKQTRKISEKTGQNENQIVLSFNIDPSLDDNEIIRIIKAIRKGLIEPIE